MYARGRCRAGRSWAVHCMEALDRACVNLGHGALGAWCQGNRPTWSVAPWLDHWGLPCCKLGAHPNGATALAPVLVGAPCMLIWLGGHGPRGIGFLLPCTLKNQYTNVKITQESIRVEANLHVMLNASRCSLPSVGAYKMSCGLQLRLVRRLRCGAGG